MTDELTTGWERELLERAAREATYPPTPSSLAMAVFARLDSPQHRPGRTARAFMTVGVTAAVIVLAFVGSLFVSKDLRGAVADFLGLAVENERIEILPAPPAGTTPTPFPTPVRLDDFATPVAATGLPFPPDIPTGYGEPRGYYVVRYLDRDVVILEYDKFTLWEADSVVFEKGLVFSKTVRVLEQLTIRGAAAYWIDGGGHIVRVVDGSGKEVTGSVRTVEGKTLVWRNGGRNYRLETQLLTKAEAVAIAESLP